MHAETLSISDLDLFCAGPDGEVWRSKLTKAFDDGRSRPEWCFALRGEAGRAAAVSYWAPYPTTRLPPGSSTKATIRRVAPTCSAAA